jgi:hypothetical protein
MNNRESSTKVSKNKLRVLVEERVAAAKEKAKPPPLTPEQQLVVDANAVAKARDKALRFAAWEAKKKERKRLRSKHHVSK